MLRLLPLLAASVSSPTAAAIPPASMTLDVVATSEGGPWKLIVTNTGEEPLRFAADARLLRLEITPPAETGAKKPPKPILCELPSPLRPDDVAHDRAVVLRPGARWEEAFDPVLYCFGDEDKALVPGATVVAKLGFAPPSKAKTLSAPFLAEPLQLDATVSPVKEIASEPFVLAAPEEAPASAPTEPPAEADPKAPKIAVATPSHIDAANDAGVVVSATARNAGKRPMLVRLRSDQLFFDVEGPTGLFRCGPEDAARAVPRDFFTTLAPEATRSFSVRLLEVCPRGTFARPGLYRIRAGIAVHDGKADPRWGVYEGVAVAEEPTLVRVRGGDGSFYVTPPLIIEAEAARPADAPAD